MAASDHLHPEQLKMFMTGSELRGYLTDSNDRGNEPPAPTNETLDEMWDRKASAAAQPEGSTFTFTDGRTGDIDEYPVQGAGLKDSLREHGYTGPTVNVTHTHSQALKDMGARADFRSVADTHHRIASGDDLEQTEGRPIYFPVQHSGDDGRSPAMPKPKRNW